MVSRDDLTCPDCNTTGLEERSRRADEFDSHQDQVIYATKCPDCGHRVDPSDIREQLSLDTDAPDSFQEQALSYLRDFSINLTTRTIGGVAGAILLISALSIGAAFGGVSVFSGERGVSATSNPAGAASGSVLTGTVQAPNGTGVDDATVAVVGNSSLTTETGPNGTYQFSSVPPGEHEVLVSSSAFGTTGETVTVEPDEPSESVSISYSSSDGGGGGSSDSESSQSSDQSSQQSTNESDDSEEEEPTAVLIGTVENPDDEAIAGASVTIEDEDLSTETDTEGRYRIEDVPTGDVDVEVTHPEFEPSTLDINVDQEDSPETLYPTLNPDPNTQAVLIGTVEDQDSGDGIDNAEIELSAQDSDNVVRTETDPEGQYRVEDVPSGDVEVSVTHPDYHSTTREIEVEPAETVTAYFELKPLPPAAWETTIRSGNSTPIFRTSAQVTTPRAPPETQSVRLWSPVSTDRASISGFASGPTNLSLPGNRMPTNMTLTIRGSPSQTAENTTTTLAPSSTNTSIPLGVDGDLASNVTVEIVPNTSTSSTNATGTLAAGTDQRVIHLAGNDLPETVAVTLNGRETLRNRTLQLDGDGNLSVDYRGNRPADGQLQITSHEGGSANASFNGTITGQETIDLNIPSFATDSVNAELTVTGNTTRGERRTDTITDGTTFDPVGNTPPAAPPNHTQPQLIINGQEDVFEMQSAAQPLGAGDSMAFETGRSAGRVNYSLSQTEDIRDARVLLEGVENTTERRANWRDIGTSTKAIDVRGSAEANVTIEVTGQRGGIDTVSNTSIADQLTYGVNATAVNQAPPTGNTHITYIADGSDIHAFNQDWNRVWTNTDAIARNITAMVYDADSESLFVATEPDVRVSPSTFDVHRLQLNPETNGYGVDASVWSGSVGNDRIHQLEYNAGSDLVYASSERGNIYAFELAGSGSVSPLWTQSVSSSAVFDMETSGQNLPYATALTANGTVTTQTAGPDDTTASSAQIWERNQPPESTGSLGFDDLDTALNQTNDVSSTDWAVVELASAAGQKPDSGLYRPDGGAGRTVTALVDLRGIDSVSVYGADQLKGYRNGSEGEISSSESDGGDGGGSAALVADSKILIGLGGGGGGGGDSDYTDTRSGRCGGAGGAGGDAGLASGGSGGDKGCAARFIDESPSEGGDGELYVTDRVHILDSERHSRRVVSLDVLGLEQQQTTPRRQHLAVNADQSQIAVAQPSGQADIIVREADSGTTSYEIAETGFEEIEDIEFVPDDTGVIVTGIRNGTPMSATYNTTGKELYHTPLASADIATLRQVDDGYAAIGADGQITQYDTAARPAGLSMRANGTALSLPTSIAEGETVSDTVTLSPGSQSLALDVTGAVDLSATWTDTTETINPEIAVSSAGTDSPQTYGGQSVGRIAAGNTTTIDITESAVLGNGSITVTNVSSSYTGPAGDVNATLVWNESWGTEEPEVEVGSYVNKNTSVMHGTNDTYALPNLPDEDQAVSISYAGGPAPKAHIQYVPVYQTETVSANVTGDTTTTTTTNLSEPLADGETTTVELPAVTADTEHITLSSPFTAAGYTVSYDYATGPRNITITDATGEQIVDRTRPLFAGQSISANVSVSGDRRFTVKSDGDYNYSTNLSYRARNGTERVTIESTGDGQPEINTSDLAPSETSTYTLPVEGSNVTIEATGPVGYEFNYTATAAPEDVTLSTGNSSRTLDGAVTSNRTVTLQNVTPDTDEMVVNATRAGFNLSATWSNLNTTADPIVKYNGTTLINESGGFTQQRTVPLADGALPAGNPTLDFQTKQGSISYTLNMTARAAAEHGNIILDDKRWRIQEVTESPLGQNHSRTPTKEINTATSGANDLRVTTQPANNITTQLRVKLSHGGAMKQSTDPKVTVVDPAGNRNTRTIADPRLEDGELTEQTTLSLPQSWFGEGTNTVQVVSENGTEVTAELTATGVEEQTRTFD